MFHIRTLFVLGMSACTENIKKNDQVTGKLPPSHATLAFCIFFVMGHYCGSGSLSLNTNTIQCTVGNILFTRIVPYLDVPFDILNLSLCLG